MTSTNFMLLTTLNATLGNSTTTTSRAVCSLSPHARAISTVLAAFVGSVIGGISDSYFTAFYTTWISGIASLRILVVSVWAIIEVLQGNPLKGDDQFHNFYGQIPGLGKLGNGFGGTRAFDDPFFRKGAEAHDPAFLG
ncbi:uncharacterized protein Z519_02622 [Cladophialophora bantiana CBS 173.52]|uniref:Uncharacterized protein n=1 Tax=Cladophialophora bantiana (strain ATCC 10958 / CBS 173.52 / CDC B-1940 / NIH 8579) TaxID=1442370 RepID=A0A0D2I217_CLAB1|nr:uncharacterized protein Z519_02622 [Cladophialophora bantiana CBS 173.52]KIW97230.1 hypothetical protein Z519_02622 [Cladophialophora bantiana CBS 173.52]